MRPAINTGSSSTGAPQLTSSSTTAPRDYAAQYLELIEPVFAARCELGAVLRQIDSEEDYLRLSAEIVETAQAWEKAARTAITNGVVLSWPSELTELTDELMRLLSREPAAAQRFTAQRSSLDVVAAINNLVELAADSESLSLLLRAQLGLGPPESC
jgi:hypothetical protein